MAAKKTAQNTGEKTNWSSTTRVSTPTIVGAGNHVYSAPYLTDGKADENATQEEEE